MALGSIRLPLWFGKYYTVYGGPFTDCPPFAFGVKMAAEIRRPFDVSIPTRDFSVPPERELNEGLLQTLKAMEEGAPVYVGCMAGRGRTGLYLALLAKLFGRNNPVEYVRMVYYKHAVETPEQYDFVTNYVPSFAVQKAIHRLKVKSILRFKKNLSAPL